MTTKKPLVTRSGDLAWGASVFAGTRVPVDTMFEYLEAGDTLEEYLKQFPTVTRRQALAVLEAARKRTLEEALPA
jgi:uncharacterized protein (DUF433 family)